MPARPLSLEERLAARGVSRRQFLKFCAAMSATLALPATFTPRIAKALNTAERLPVVWLEFQDCAGNTESFLRADSPGVADIVLEQISLEYHETIMAPAGHRAEHSLDMVLEHYPGQYLAIVEGSIPTANGGVYCTIAGRTALSIAQRVCSNALATIAVGACAWDGGWPAASPNPTGAVGVRQAVPGLKNLINLPGCPMNVINLTAIIVHYLTFKTNCQQPTNRDVPSLPTGNSSTTTVSDADTSTPGASSSAGATKDTVWAGVCTKWGAKVRKPTRTVRRLDGTEPPTGPLVQGMGALDVCRRVSGTPCRRFYERFCRRLRVSALR
jgi:hypothetical protein